MNRILILLCFTFSIHAAKVVLTDGRKLESCTVGEKNNEVFCLNGNESVYISSPYDSEPIAFELNDSLINSRVKVSYIDHIVGDDGDFLYAQNGFDLIDNSQHDIKGKVLDITYNQKLANTLLPESSADFPNILEKIKNVAQQNIKRLEKQESEDELYIKVNNKKVNCQRLKGNGCSLTECGDSLVLFGPYGGNAGFINLPISKGRIDFTLPEVNEVYFSNDELAIGYPVDKSINAVRNTVPSKFVNHSSFSEYMKQGGVSYIKRAVQNCKGINANIFDKLSADVINEYKNASMIELVDFIDGSVESILVNELALPEIVCTHNGAYYNPEAYKKVAGKQSKQLSVISIEKAQELFKKARQRDDIAWGYTEDGCYARAHLMAEMFEDEGIKTDKVWARGRLTIPNGYGQTWAYHVAPIVHVLQHDAPAKTMVIDPSISTAPTDVDEWLSTMKVDPASVRTHDYPAPLNGVSFGRVSVSFSNSDPYWPGYDQYSRETKDSMAISRMDEYLMYQ